VDARRLHPLEDTDQTAAVQIRALLARLPAVRPVPWFVFDAGYDSAQLSLDLTEAPVAVLVWLRADRCFYADPPPRAQAARAGRAATAPSSPAPTRPPGRSRPPPSTPPTSSTAPSPCTPGPGCTPSSTATPATAAVGPGQSCAALSSACRWSAFPPGPARRRCCGCGGPAPRACSWIWTLPGAPTPAGSTWSTPSASPSRPWAGPPHGCGIPSRPTAGPGWCWPATPNSGWPAPSPATNACHGSGPARPASCPPTGCGGVSATSGRTRLAGCCAETRRALPRPAQGQLPGTRGALPGDQESPQEAPQ
jgi:hypothetical protein